VKTVHNKEAQGSCDIIGKVRVGSSIFCNTKNSATKQTCGMHTEYGVYNSKMYKIIHTEYGNYRNKIIHTEYGDYHKKGTR
jgi:hypothetical protein